MMHDPGTAIFWLTGVLGLICTLTIAVRLWIRLKKKFFAVDDAFMAIGLVFYLATNLLACQAVREGIGRADYVVDYSRPLEAIRLVTIWSFTFAVSTIPVRTSIACALFKITYGRRHYKTYINIVICAVWAAATIQCLWIGFGACHPFPYLWDSVDLVGKCAPIDTIVSSIWMFAIVSIVIDIILVVIPAIVLWNLRMDRWRKIQTWLFLAAGLFATGATIGRLFFLGGYRDLAFWSTNFYMKLAGVIIASQLEIGLAIFCSSLGVFNQVKDHLIQQRRAKLLDLPESGRKKPYKFFGKSVEISGGHPQPKETMSKKLRRLAKKKEPEEESIPLALVGHEHDCILIETTTETTVEWDFEGAYGYADGTKVHAGEDGDLAPLFAGAPTSRLELELQKFPAIPASASTTTRTDTATTSTQEAFGSSGTHRRAARRNKAGKKRLIARK